MTVGHPALALPPTGSPLNTPRRLVASPIRTWLVVLGGGVNGVQACVGKGRNWGAGQTRVINDASAGGDQNPGSHRPLDRCAAPSESVLLPAGATLGYPEPGLPALSGGNPLIQVRMVVLGCPLSPWTVQHAFVWPTD